MIKGIKSKLSNKRFWYVVCVRGLFYTLEFVLMAFAFHKLQDTAVSYVTERATASTMGFFRDYAGLIQTEDGELLSVFQGITLLALVGVPGMYALVWLHRVIQWITLQDLRSQIRKLKTENNLLQQQVK